MNKKGWEGKLTARKRNSTLSSGSLRPKSKSDRRPCPDGPDDEVEVPDSDSVISLVVVVEVVVADAACC